MDQTKDDLSDSGIGTTPRLKDIEANKDTIVEMKGKSSLSARVCTDRDPRTKTRLYTR